MKYRLSVTTSFHFITSNSGIWFRPEYQANIRPIFIKENIKMLVHAM
jgi:hypothetical protein